MPAGGGCGGGFLPQQHGGDAGLRFKVSLDGQRGQGLGPQVQVLRQGDGTGGEEGLQFLEQFPPGLGALARVPFRPQGARARDARAL